MRHRSMRSKSEILKVCEMKGWSVDVPDDSERDLHIHFKFSESDVDIKGGLTGTLSINLKHRKFNGYFKNFTGSSATSATFHSHIYHEYSEDKWYEELMKVVYHIIPEPSLMQDGEPLHSLFHNGEMHSVDDGTIESIEVQMVNGQSAKVPWARVNATSGSTYMFNLALCDWVVLARDEAQS